jgi:hypothetical protein
VQDPQGLWVPTLAGAGEVVAGQGLAAGLDRVQHIALGVVAAAVGVDPDDGVSLARQRGVGSPLPAGTSLPAPRPGTTGQHHSEDYGEREVDEVEWQGGRVYLRLGARCDIRREADLSLRQ